MANSWFKIHFVESITPSVMLLGVVIYHSKVG